MLRIIQTRGIGAQRALRSTRQPSLAGSLVYNRTMQLQQWMRPFRQQVGYGFRHFANNVEVDSLKDDVYTISIIGRPNVGKSTLFNKLMGQQLALVDRTPGLTRDRREGIIDDGIFDVPVRLVDTAGFEGTRDLDDRKLSRRNLNKQLIEDMLKQTRNALIYSDLALFVMDTREGITYNDVALYQWLTLQSMQIQSDKVKIKATEKLREERSRDGPTMEDFEEAVVVPQGVELLELEKKYGKSKEKKELDPLEKQKLKEKVNYQERKKLREMKIQQMTETFQKQFKNLDDLFLENDIPIPKILYIANKAEDGYEGDILGEFYQQFPYASDPDSGVKEPLFISAEHGDGFTDLYGAIKNEIPLEQLQKYENRRAKRLDRFVTLKDQLMDEIVQLRMDMMTQENEQGDDQKNDDTEDDLEMFVRTWEKDFDRANQDPGNNSDFDSDNDINPIDSINQLGQTAPGSTSSTGGISSDNVRKSKPIQLSIVGRPNIGKSTFVNSLLREHRVVANDMPGTTRDCVQVQWSYNGCRVILVDTAGIKPGTGLPKDAVDIMVNDQVQTTVNYSHVVCVMIDSMEAFTGVDMQIIDKVLEEGRAIVVVANKWDLVDDKYKKKAVQWMEKQLEKGLGQAKGIPIAFVSAKTGTRVDQVMTEVLRVYEKWNTRVSTGLLNKWIHEFSKVQRMPNDQGKHLKLKYLMQIRSRPPTFFVFCNRKSLVTDNFEQYLRSCISKEFGFTGVPIRLLLRDSRSQYASKRLSGLSAAAKKILTRIKQYKTKQASPTHRRRVIGSKHLYTRGFRAKTAKSWKRY